MAARPVLAQKNENQVLIQQGLLQKQPISKPNNTMPIIKFAKNEETSTVQTSTSFSAASFKVPALISKAPQKEIINLSDEETEDDMSIDQLESSLENIDIGDDDDPQFVSSYVNDIFAFLYTKEQEVRIAKNYFDNLPNIQPKHRDIMANWISESSIRLNLLSETPFLAVNILDQVLSTVRVSRKKLSLVSVSALLIASKFEETYAPTMSDLHIISENMFQDNQILEMERILLNKIEFNLCVAIPLHFLRRFSKAARSDSYTHTLAKYITELSILHYEMVNYLPSEIAAASVYIARKMRGIHPVWNSNLRHYTRYSEHHLSSVVSTLNQFVTLHWNKPNNDKNAIFSKYANRRLLSVANTPAVLISFVV